jgi:NAD(P)H dehydrogenase (quinone)
MAKIFIVYYSMYGHVKTMAQKIKEGVDKVDGCEGVLYQVPETLPEEVLGKMGAPPKDADIPVINAADLEQADGIIFGIPTRFGMAAAQMKSFMDSTGGLWQGGKLAGKPAGIFVSTGTQVRT